MHFFQKAAVITAVVTAFLLGSAAVSASEPQYHTVQKGDTCYQIAKNYGTELSAVLNANGIKASETIYPGRTIIIDPNAKNTSGANYTVKKGDSLHSIATAYGTTVSALKQKNGLTANRIYEGQKLLVAQNQTNIGSITQDEILLMAKMIYAEARGESDLGQLAVGAVIMNRIKSNLFPNTLSGVLYQKNQFSAINDGQFYNLSPDDRAISAAYKAAAGNDPTYGALYYWNPKKANNSWLNKKPILVTIGDHVFAK